MSDADLSCSICVLKMYIYTCMCVYKCGRVYTCVYTDILYDV